MKVEVLISTMNQKDMSLVKKMNIKTDALIINQCNQQEKKEIIFRNKKIRMLSFTERGLSKSRNRALQNSNADICIIADDDLVYEDNYEDTIMEAYKKYSDTDIIAFEVPSTNESRRTSVLREGNVDFLHSMKLASFQITLKRETLINKNVKFNEVFGAGAKYTCGEENIFLADCLRKGLKIVYVKEKIAVVNHNESTWYNGFDKNLFKTKGAMFYELNHALTHLLIIQFAIRKWKLYKKNVKFFVAYRYMLDGLSEYKKYKGDKTKL